MGYPRKQIITFFLSNKCPLDCCYCYVPKIKNIPVEYQTIDLEFAIASLSDYFRTSSSRDIRFFGAGEPTTAFEKMQIIRDEAYKIAGNKLTVELQSNGYFSDRIANWIEDNVHTLWISCDGPPKYHDKYRPLKNGGKSSDIITKNIKRFANSSRVRLGVRATILEENFSEQINILEYFSTLGVRYVCVAPTYYSITNSNIGTPSLINFSKYFVPAFYRALELSMFYQTHLIADFDEEIDVFCRACTPNPHITTDGYVTSCDWALFGPEFLPGPLQQLTYGYWDKDEKKIIYDNDTIYKLRERNAKNLSESSCKNCKVLYNCAGGCLSKNIVITGDMNKPSEDWCQAIEYLSEKIPRNQGLFPIVHS